MRRACLFSFLFALHAQQDWIQQGEQLNAARKFGEAAAVFQKGIDQGSAADRVSMARALLGLGRARFNLDELTPAREATERSAAIARESADKIAEAEALRLLANIDRPLGMLVESKDAAERARSLFASAGNLHHAAGMLISLALTVGEMGDTPAKIALLRQCLREIDERGYHDLEGTVILDLSVVYFDQGDYEHAMEYDQRAARIDEQAAAPDHLALSRDYANMAVIAARLGRDRDALEDYARAIREAQAAKHALMENFNLWNRAFFYRTRGQAARALEDIRPAAAYYAKSENKTQGLQVQSELALTLLDLGKADAAAKLAQSLVVEGRRYAAPRPLQDALEALGQASMRLGLREQARAAFLEDIGLTESARVRMIGGPGEKQNSLINQIVSYHGMVDLLAEDGRGAEALEFAERAKARLLVDGFAAGSVTGAMTPEEKRRERELSDAVTRLDRQITTNPDTGGLTAFQRAADALDAFRADLYRAHPDLRLARGEFKPVTPGEIAGLLPDDHTAILGYTLTRDNAWLFAIARDGMTLHRLPKSSALAADVERLRGQLASRDPGYRGTAATIWRQVLGPAAAALRGKHRLILVPDGALWNLPFQALISPAGRHVVEDAAVFYAPSLTALREARRRPRGRASQTLLAFGGAEPEGAIREARQVGDLYGNDSAVYVAAQAAKERWKAMAPEYSVLHLATHGVLNSSTPLYSYLALPGGDGRLTAREILDLHLNADLTVLSACETARGDFRPGEGMIGMSWAFLVAGSPATVVSQWKVDSEASTQLMLAFHRGLRGAGGEHRAEALQRASLEVLAMPQFRHPFYWAGFVLIGVGY